MAEKMKQLDPHQASIEAIAGRGTSSITSSPPHLGASIELANEEKALPYFIEVPEEELHQNDDSDCEIVECGPSLPFSARQRKTCERTAFARDLASSLKTEPKLEDEEEDSSPIVPPALQTRIAAMGEEHELGRIVPPPGTRKRAPQRCLFCLEHGRGNVLLKECRRSSHHPINTQDCEGCRVWERLNSRRKKRGSNDHLMTSPEQRTTHPAMSNSPFAYPTSQLS